MENRMGIGKKLSMGIVAGTYGLGVVIVAALLIVFILKVDIVLFPDAMLPMQLYEQASVWLAWGTLPMGIASVVFYKRFHVSERSNRTVNTICTFLPLTVCFCFFLYWVIAWGTGFVFLF